MISQYHTTEAKQICLFNLEHGLSENMKVFNLCFRYYYDGDMISKVQGKRFVYKFVCDLKQVGTMD